MPPPPGEALARNLLETYGLIRMADATRSGRRRVRVPQAVIDQIELKIATWESSPRHGRGRPQDVDRPGEVQALPQPS